MRLHDLQLSLIVQRPVLLEITVKIIQNVFALNFLCDWKSGTRFHARIQRRELALVLALSAGRWPWPTSDSTASSNIFSTPLNPRIPSARALEVS